MTNNADATSIAVHMQATILEVLIVSPFWYNGEMVYKSVRKILAMLGTNREVDEIVDDPPLLGRPRRLRLAGEIHDFTTFLYHYFLMSIVMNAATREDVE